MKPLISASRPPKKAVFAVECAENGRETDFGGKMSIEKEISNAIAKCVKNNGGRLPSSEVLAAAIMRMMPPVEHAVWQDPLTEADKAARRSPAIRVVIPEGFIEVGE